jgi:hypothetical protein
MSHTATLDPSPELQTQATPPKPLTVKELGIPYRITKENAAEFAKRGATKRAQMRQAREIAASAASLAATAGPPDPFVIELAHAQAEILQKLRNTPNSRDKMQLARALRDLRETYHMVTGTPKPGMIKPGSARPMPRQLVAPIPTVTPVTPVTAQSGEAMPTMPAATPAESS